MSHPPTEDDQRTIKRCYSNLQNHNHNSKNYSTVYQSTNSLKKPLNQLFYHHFINDQDPLTHLEISQNFINFKAPSQTQKSLNQNYLTTKCEENQNHQNQNYSNCCTRLFTFMESTQKEKLIDQNKENQFNENLLYKKPSIKKSLKPNINDLPLKLTPKTQGSAKFLKKISCHLKNRQKLTSEGFLNVPKSKQHELLNFIEGSRKKREELLIQLENLDFNCLESLCPDNIKYLTPQERFSKKYTPKIKINSLRNSHNGYKSNNNFFRKQSITNDKKSPRVILKENLRQRHFSSNSFLKSNQTILPKNSFDSQRNKARSQSQRLKKQNKLQRQPGIQPKKNFVQRNQLEVKLMKNNQSGKISFRKLQPKQQLNDNIQQSSRNKICKRQKQIKQSNIGFKQEKHKKTMEELMQRKKELEKELFNLNDDIVLFNKKKKKLAKGIK